MKEDWGGYLCLYRLRQAKEKKSGNFDFDSPESKVGWMDMKEPNAACQG